MKHSIAAVVLTALLASPCLAQRAASTRQIDGPTAGVLSAAIDALAREHYGEARRLANTLDHKSLSAFERSRVEQLLFNAGQKASRRSRRGTQRRRKPMPLRITCSPSPITNPAIWRKRWARLARRSSAWSNRRKAGCRC
jgi:hypothetical protein